MTLELLNHWHRCRRGLPCPVCGRTDWCMVSKDRAFAVCPRTHSEYEFGEAGYLHVLQPGHKLPAAIKDEVQKPINYRRWAELHRKCMAAVPADAAHELADKLGLDIFCLQAIGLGWHERWRAWTFPMYDATANVTGLRVRYKDGRKAAIPESRSGVFLECVKAPPPECVYITEGTTDTVAALQLGLRCIGRPSCLGGSAIIATMLSRFTGEVIIIADRGGPGQRGAAKLADRLSGSHKTKVIVPLANDLRQWVNQGATTDAVLALAGAANVWKEAA